MPRETAQGPEDDAKPHYHSHALTRGLETLRAVAITNEPTTLTTIHEVTGYPKSTLVRLLSVLEEQGHLVRIDERPSYQLGHGLLPIAMGYFSAFSGTDLLRPHLTALAQATGWTANFGSLVGDRILHLCVEFPNRPIYYTTTEGSFAPSYCTGLGKAILSCLDRADAVKLLPAEPFERLTGRTIVTVNDMMNELERVRARGYAIDAEEADPGLRCLSLPVVHNSVLLGAISVSGPSGESNIEQEEKAVAALRETRANILMIPDLPAILGSVER